MVACVVHNHKGVGSSPTSATRAVKSGRLGILLRGKEQFTTGCPCSSRFPHILQTGKTVGGSERRAYPFCYNSSTGRATAL